MNECRSYQCNHLCQTVCEKENGRTNERKKDKENDAKAKQLQECKRTERGYKKGSEDNMTGGK